MHHKRALSPNVPACCISGQTEHGTYDVLPLSPQPPSVQTEQACLLACCKEVLVVQSTTPCGAASIGVCELYNVLGMMAAKDAFDLNACLPAAAVPKLMLYMACASVSSK